MSYYPTERRGGCMESISRCCRQVYVYPFDSRKLLYVVGGVVGVVLVAGVWSALSSNDQQPNFKPGSTVLLEQPLVVGCNFFPTNLKNLVHNNVSSVKFNENLLNDTVFGNVSCKSCQTDISRLKSGLVGSQIWNINVPCDAKHMDAVALTLEQLDAVTRLINSYPDDLYLAKSADDVIRDFNINNKRLGSIIAVSSGHSIDGRLAVLRSLKALGVQVMAITSYCFTDWATSYSNDTNALATVGLSDFGKAVVKEMNRLGIVIDLSDASHQTQLDVLAITKAPVIFSHTAAFSIVNNIRNIRDDVLDKMKENKGVVMVTFAKKYINPGGFNEVIDHINYFKNKLGAAGVGIGAEFDAEDEVFSPELSDVSKFPVLFDQLGINNTNREELKNFAGGNFLRVLGDVEKYAKSAENLPVDETYLLPFNGTCYSDIRNHTKIDPSSKVMKISIPPTVATAATTVTPAPPITNNTTPSIATTEPTNKTEVTTKATQ